MNNKTVEWDKPLHIPPGLQDTHHPLADLDPHAQSYKATPARQLGSTAPRGSAPLSRPGRDHAERKGPHPNAIQSKSKAAPAPEPSVLGSSLSSTNLHG